MKNGFTTDPYAALAGLIGIALLGLLVIGGGLIVSGLNDRSWIQMVGGAVLWVGLSWMTWQAGRVIRRALREARGEEASGA